MWCSSIHYYVSSEIPWLNIRDLQTPSDPLAYLISELPPSWPSVTLWLKAAPQGKLQIVPNLEMVSERKIESSPLVTGFVKMLRHLSLTPWYHATPPHITGPALRGWICKRGSPVLPHIWATSKAISSTFKVHLESIHFSPSSKSPSSLTCWPLNRSLHFHLCPPSICCQQSSQSDSVKAQLRLEHSAQNSPISWKAKANRLAMAPQAPHDLTAHHLPDIISCWTCLAHFAPDLRALLADLVPAVPCVQDTQH